MSDIGKEHIEDMGRLIAAMNRAAESEPVPQDNRSETIKPVGDMAMILEAFRNATDEMAEQASTNTTLRAALETESTDNGARVGSWLIEKREITGSKGYTYDIVHVITKEPVATSLRLYEAALGLVNELNAGQPLTTRKCRDILFWEDEYTKAIMEARQFKRKMTLTEGAAYDIAEARFTDMRSRAMKAKNAIEKTVRS